MSESVGVPSEIVGRIRSVCLGLPEVYEEQAWVGVRWRVRKRTFAHLLSVEAGWPPAYARAVGNDGPVVVLTFRAVGDELAALSSAGHPYFWPGWGPNIVGMVLEAGVDWGEVGELLTDSYCVMAPRKLAGLVRRPAD